jgi:molecular chaperone GrpE
MTETNQKEAGKEEKKEEQESTEESLEMLKKKLAECEKIKNDYLAGWQRARADFINYKKEEQERFSVFFEIELGEIILKLLEIYDNFEKAKKSVPPDLKDNLYIKGFFQIQQSFWKLLEDFGVERIKTEGERFDPNWHEAVESSLNKEVKEGFIVEELQPGYKLKGRLLKTAKVKVAQ